MEHIDKLLKVVCALRDRHDGCSWDLEQNFSSIAPYTVEEAYEVADAIERGDMNDLCDELGDLLFQVAFHARMAEEAGYFDFDEVVSRITGKLIRRHPHVFGSREERASGPQADGWERIKEQERSESGDSSALAGIAKAIPALTRAARLGQRASRVGFDWPDRRGVRDKINEELAELEEAVGTRKKDRIDEEFGDLLFAVVNMARHLDIDAEQALVSANRKFERRFRDMEVAITSTGKRMRDFNLETLESCWRAAKKRTA